MEGYSERQEDEVEFLQAVFPAGEFEDLRLKDPWKIHRPPEFTLFLTPQKSMGGSVKDQRPVSVKLHTKYPIDYPDSVPELSFNEPQGLTSDQVKELTEEVEKLAQEKVGEVMMLELAQHIQAFLHKHDRPPVSLYEEMLQRKRAEEKREMERKEKERQLSRMKEEEEHRQIEEEIMRKKAELQEHHSGDSEEMDSEEDSGSNTSKGLTYETPPTGTPPSTTQSPQPAASPVSATVARRGGGEDGRTGVKGHKYARIQRGRHLGDSCAGGNSVFVAMDIDTGELLVIYEWSLQCRTIKKGDTRRLKQVSSIQQEFDSIQSRGIHHINLVQYLAMSHTYNEDDNTISVELHMEYVGGGCMSNLLRNPFCGPLHGETLCHYSKQLLEALSYLHSQGIVHNDLRPSLVFLDGGGVKLGGFSIVKRLADLHRTMNVHMKPPSVAAEDEGAWQGVWPTGRMGGKKGDILKLGMLVLCMAVGKLDISYPPSIPDHLSPSLRDFLTKCLDRNEQRRFPAHDLLLHPFISPSPHSSKPLSSVTAASLTQHKTIPGAIPSLAAPMQFQRSDSIVGSPAKPLLMGRSRLETEFEELEVLGSGGFGDVIKVRNHLDGRLYALKKIRIRSDSKMMTRITREVELLSQMNHENVVRYYNAWIETYGKEEMKRLSGVDLSELQSDSEEESGDLSHDDDDDQTNGISIEFRNETSPSEASDSDSDISDSELNPFHSTFNAKDDDIDSFVTFEASSISGCGRKSHDWTGEEGDGVFMDGFSDSSGEGRNILGELESEVMNTSLRRFRPSATTESSDTVVFMDSSAMTSSKTIPLKGKQRRERRKQKDSNQLQFLYIQMEYCESETLRQLIDAGGLHVNEDKVWRLFREIVEGLEHIHSKGMIHRDLKPGNIFLNLSGHIKIGDFGLATSYKQSSITVNPNTSILDNIREGETGLVGTAMYVSPELLKPDVRYTQKVDIYSVGIILFEMCHPPAATAMERHKMLVEIRKREIIFPPSFDKEKLTQMKVIRWLLNHNPHDRPTSKQLLQSPLIPLKMEDEELQEVLQRTLQSTNSTQYCHLIDKLFAQEGSRVSEFSYFLDTQDNKRSLQNVKKNKFSFCYNLLQQLVRSRLESLFTRHGATPLSPPLLLPRSSDLYSGGGGALSLAQFMDRSGAIVTLPHDHRVSFARYVSHHDISYLKRYCIAPVYRETKVLGSHPREHLECQFDIVSPSPTSLVPDAEVISLVSELISDVPGLQEGHYRVLINHTSLLTSVLSYTSVPRNRHKELHTLLQKITNGTVKSSELEKWLKEKNLQLSPLAMKTLQKFISAEVEFGSETVRSLLDPLLRDKTAGSYSSLALQDLTTVVDNLRRFGAKEMVYLCPGLPPAQPHFGGVVFQYVTTPTASQGGVKRSRRSRRVPLARGGRYDPLLSEFRRPGKQQNHPNVSLVGVSIMWEGLMGGFLNAYQQGNCHVIKCSVLVCWLGRESLQRECIDLVKELWSQGISADLLNESVDVDSIEDIQDFCRRNFIPHIVILNDKTLLFERKQVKLRTLESGKVIEKTPTISELVDYLQQRQMKHHNVERSDSSEARETVRASGSYSSEGQSNTLPPVNVTTVIEGKMTGHIKRRYHDQALKKLIPLLQKFSSKQPFEVVVVDLKADHLSALAAECNKLLGTNESCDLSGVVKSLCEAHSDMNKKYIAKICETMLQLFTSKKRLPMVFMYSLTAEFCQTVINSLESLTTS